MPTSFDPKTPCLNRKRIVDMQGLYRRPSTCRQTNDFAAVIAPREVTFPRLASWIEQTLAPACRWIATVRLSAFVTVAGAAR
jgi:hypothetical protein